MRLTYIAKTLYVHYANTYLYGNFVYCVHSGNEPQRILKEQPYSHDKFQIVAPNITCTFEKNHRKKCC